MLIKIWKSDKCIQTELVKVVLHVSERCLGECLVLDGGHHLGPERLELRQTGPVIRRQGAPPREQRADGLGEVHLARVLQGNGDQAHSEMPTLPHTTILKSRALKSFGLYCFVLTQIAP